MYLPCQRGIRRPWVHPAPSWDGHQWGADTLPTSSLASAPTVAGRRNAKSTLVLFNTRF